MSKSKKKNQKLEEFIPEQMDTSVADENSGQAEATIGGEASVIPKVDEMDEANKPSPAIHNETKVIDPSDSRNVDYVEEKGPQKNLSAKKTFQEIMADRARQQKEVQDRNIARNKAFAEARAKKFKENVEAKKVR